MYPSVSVQGHSWQSFRGVEDLGGDLGRRVWEFGVWGSRLSDSGFAREGGSLELAAGFPALFSWQLQAKVAEVQAPNF